MPDDEKILVLIKKAELKIEKTAHQLLASSDLTSTQLKILIILFTNPEKNYRQIDLETHFSLTNPTVTGILNNMEKKGLIQRRKHPRDSRSKVIVPTQEAYRRKEEWIALYEVLEQRLTRNLTPADRGALSAQLKKLLAEEPES